jgi:hypothetical protein
MEYVTFVARRSIWRLYKGVGGHHRQLRERLGMDRLSGLGTGSSSVFWAFGSRAEPRRDFIQRVRLPNLDSEDARWGGHRVGAVAGSHDSEGALAIALPDRLREGTAVWRFQGRYWKGLELAVTPDISSKVAWLDMSLCVYESTARRLTLLHLDTGLTEEGPRGCCPVVAPEIREWYAICQGKVVRFEFHNPFGRAAKPVEGIDFGNVTSLQVTADGQVWAWTEPRIGYQSKGFIQQKGCRRERFPEVDTGVSAVLGPLSLP